MKTTLHHIDLIIILLYLVICLGLGFYKSRNIKSIREYALGTGFTPTIVLVAMIFATNIDAGASMGVIERIFSMGLIFAAARMLSPLFWIITAKIFTPNIEQFKDCISLSDIMEKLYGKFGRWSTNIAAGLTAVGAVAAQVTAIGYILNYFLGIEQYIGIFVAFGILIAYSSLGGARAIAMADVFQFGIFYVAIPTACAIAFQDIGGIEGLKQSLPSEFIKLDINHSNFWLFISFIFYALMPPAEPTFVQRFLMANSSKQLKHTFYIIAAINVPFVFVLCMIGFIIKAKAPEIDGNTAFLYLISNYLPVGIVGFLVAGLLAIVMSTANSLLNTTSVLFAHDIGKMIFKKMTDKQELLLARLMTVAIGLFSIFISLGGGKSIIQLMWLSENFWYPVMLVPVIAGFIGYRPSKLSFIISVFTSMFVTSLTAYLCNGFDTLSMLFGMISSIFGMAIPHYLQNYKNLRSDFAITSLVQSTVKAIYAFANSCRPTIIMSSIRRRVNESSPHYYTFTIFAILYYLVPLFSTALTGNLTHDLIIYFRGIAAIMCIILCFYEYLPRSWVSRYLPIYWYACLFFCLPFISTYALLGSQTDLIWVVNAIFSTFLLAMIVDMRSFITIQILGVIAGYTLYKLMGITSPLELPVHGGFSFAAFVYCFAALILAAVMKKFQDDRMQNFQFIGGAVAHEVRTPLAYAGMAAEAIDAIVKNASVKNKANQEYTLTLNQEDFERLKEFSNEVKNSSNKGIQAVDMVLKSFKEVSSTPSDTATYNISEVVNKAITEYGLNESERSRITFSAQNDFEFYGSFDQMKHIFFNLIKNSYAYGGKEVKIDISLKDNTLYFRDNGKGIDPEHLPFIFNKFSSFAPNGGSGIGLAFCSMVMEKIGGSIKCESVKGSHTTFMLHFPKYQHQLML